MSGRFVIVASVVVALSAPAVAQEKGKAEPRPLTAERIYPGHEFAAEDASIQWLAEGSAYTTWEASKETEGARDLVFHDPAAGKSEVIVPAAQLIPSGEKSPLAVDGYTLSNDRSRLLIFTNAKRVWRQNTRGDYWVLDRGARELRKLGGGAPPSSLMFAKMAPVGPMVAYVKENNLHAEDLRNGQVIALTSSSSPDEINGTFDWVYEEELGLRDGFRWSPDGASIAYWQLNTRGVREYPLVNTTDSLYPKITPVKYPKVGERNADCRVGIVSIAERSTTWIPMSAEESYIAGIKWAGATELVLQRLNRLQNTASVLSVQKDRLDFVSPILTERDDAWLDLQDDLPWLRHGKQVEGFLWLSERDGWRHAYRVSLSGGTPTPITTGDFDVIGIVGVDNPHSAAYFTATPENPTQKYLFRVGLDGKGQKRITPSDQPGTHDYDISPDGQFAVHRYSNAGTPPLIELIRLPSHERVKLFTDNDRLKKVIAGLAAVKTEFFRVDIGGGVALDGWCLLPPRLDSKAKYPLLVHVYGEPAMQTVLDRWGGVNQLWHRMLAERGYVVMSVDNRGTPAPRGREWRKAVHRKVGIVAPEEQAAAVNAVLKQRPYLDPRRVGVWGWSGGGSMSLHAIFRFPELYTTAIAIAPVANQRLYDTIYQERYMGMPGENVEGYIQGSPITFAHRLKGNLLLIHGTGDDNCHYQGTEALINELIRLDKPFSMMAYPNRSHAISEGPNTTLHLRQLMERFLREKLPPGPSPASKSP